MSVFGKILSRVLPSNVLSAKPIPKKRMELLWMDADVLASIAGSENGFRVFGLDRPAGSFDAGSVSQADAKWAVAVDAIAAVAVGASERGDSRKAIEYYEKVLRMAPGCDLYLMSIGCCYANMGDPKTGLQYLERAAEISPHRERIRDNLASVQIAARRAG